MSTTTRPRSAPPALPPTAPQGALALDRDVSENSLRDLLRIAGGIDSDYEKAEFLLEYGELYMRTVALQNDLSDLVETIDSHYERDRVSAALWRSERRQKGTRRP